MKCGTYILDYQSIPIDNISLQCPQSTTVDIENIIFGMYAANALDYVTICDLQSKNYSDKYKKDITTVFEKYNCSQFVNEQLIRDRINKECRDENGNNKNSCKISTQSIHSLSVIGT